MTTAATDAVAFLRAIAEHDPDRRCRREAERAVTVLAVGPGAARRPGPATDGDVGRHPRAAATAEDVRTALLTDSGFPAELTALASLPEAAATDLLTELVELLLAAAGNASTAVLDRATRRVGDVHRALSGDGARVVAANLPPADAPAVHERQRAWAGGVLALVDTGQVLRLVRDELVDGEAAERLAALRLLVAAAPRLAEQPRLPPPAAATAGLVELQLLVELGLDPPRRVRSRRAPPVPAPAGSPTASPAETHTESPPDAPQRTAYARLDAPQRVTPREAFELRVGLAQAPGGGPNPRVALSVPGGAFTLTVTIMAHGFDVIGGTSLTRVIPVSEDDPYAYEVIRLSAADDPGLADVRRIMAIYSVDGRPLGVAQCDITVGAAGTAGAAAEPTQPLPTTPVSPASPVSSVAWVLPTDADARPDLEVIVVHGNDAVGVARLYWHVQSPHPTIGTQILTDQELPADVAEQMRQIYAGVDARAGRVDLGSYLTGAGVIVSRAIPEELWAVFAEAARCADRAPSVLLATADAHVPWELAAVPAPWCADAPAVLGAQTVLGRWPYRTETRSPAPPTRIDLTAMAVVSGRYADGERLVEAEQEAAALRERYRAHDVSARLPDVLGCLRGSPSADLVHMAVHGRFDTVGVKDGIYLLDGAYLSHVVVLGIRQGPVRLAFLNACQLGQGREVLGEYSGMAASLLDIGAGAVVAPMWKVDDEVARSVAEQFYPAVLCPTGTDPSDAVSPAAFLRGQRCATRGVENGPQGSRLAYVYFGHPLLRVTWSGSAAEPSIAADAASGPAPPP